MRDFTSRERALICNALTMWAVENRKHIKTMCDAAEDPDAPEITRLADQLESDADLAIGLVEELE